MTAEQMGLFAHNTQTPISEELPLEGERWIDPANRDEFIYNGAGYFESILTVNRLVKLEKDGRHYCMFLKKHVELIRCNNDPKVLLENVLEVAANRGPEYVETCLKFLEEEGATRENPSWYAVREVEKKLEDWQRSKVKPKSRAKASKEKWDKFDEELEDMAKRAKPGPDEVVNETEQKLALECNRWIKEQGGMSPLNPAEAHELLKFNLCEAKVKEVMEKAMSMGWKPDFEEDQISPEAPDESAEVEASTAAEEDAIDVDTADAETVEETEGSRVEIPALLDTQNRPEAKEKTCNEETKPDQNKSVEVKETAPTTDTEAVKPSCAAAKDGDKPLEDHNDAKIDPVKAESSTSEAPQKPEEKPTLVELENGDWMDVETGEVMISREYVHRMASAESDLQLPANTKFEIKNEETAAIYIGMIRRRQDEIVNAVQFAASVINKKLSDLNGLQRCFNPQFKTFLLSTMKRKKDGSLDGKTYNTHKGKAFLEVFGGLDIFDKPEFKEWVETMDEEQCPLEGIDLVEEVSKVFVELPAETPQDFLDTIQELCPEAIITPSKTTTVRQPNFEIIEERAKAGDKIPGARYFKPDEAGIVKFGSSTERSGFSINNITALFNAERKDVQTKYITLTDPRYAVPYKIEKKKDAKTTKKNTKKGAAYENPEQDADQRSGDEAS